MQNHTKVIADGLIAIAKAIENGFKYLGTLNKPQMTESPVKQENLLENLEEIPIIEQHPLEGVEDDEEENEDDEELPEVPLHLNGTLPDSKQ